MNSSLKNLENFKKYIKDIPIFEVSAFRDEGLTEVIHALSDILDKTIKKPLYEEEKFESHVLYQFKEEKPFTIQKENDVWVIKGEKVEKLLRMTRFTTEEAAFRFAGKLRKMGIDDELRARGAKEGDTIRILDFEFDYQE